MKKLSFIAILLFSVVWLFPAKTQAQRLNTLDSLTFTNNFAFTSFPITGDLPPGETRRNIGVYVTNSTTGVIEVSFSDINGTADTTHWKKKIKRNGYCFFPDVKQPKIHVKALSGNGKVYIEVIRGGANYPIQEINGTISYDSSARLTAYYKEPLLNSNYRIARIGTSLTADGDKALSNGGLLGQKFTNYLYKEIAWFVSPADVTVSGSSYTITNSKLLDGSALKVRGVNSSLAFTMYGDELTLITAQERNNIGASIIELYVDGTLYDSFSNYNDASGGTLNFTATGNGTKTKFRLDRSFCYNPRTLTVNGVAKTIKQETSNDNLGSAVFGGYDAILIRKFQKINNKPVVNNYIWFATAPTNGHDITCTVDYGENIMFTQGTITEIKDSIGSAILEGSYGDKSLDSTGSTISADHLSFRQSDDRAVKTWKFNEFKDRTFEFKIKSLDSRASGTPYFIFNGATNRYQKIMNAGISGYRAYNFAYGDTTADIRTYVTVQDWKPDIAILEHGANDMTDPVFNFYIASKSYSNLTEQQVRDYPVRWIKTVTFNNPTYTVESAVLNISNVSKNSITIESSGVTYDSIPKAGDILQIGTYHIDNREIAYRVIDSWDNTNKIATFTEPLTVSEFISIDSLGDLVNQNVKIYRPLYYDASMSKIIQRLKSANKDITLSVVSTICQNEYIRTSYSRKIKSIARQHNVLFGDIAKELTKFTYSQNRNTQAYLTTANNTVANGSSSYTLVTNAGANPQGVNQIKYWSVKVNGVERYGKGCYIEGGLKGCMGNSILTGSLVTTSWLSAWSKYSTELLATKVYFTYGVPTNGDSIIVKYSTTLTTDDNTHPNLTYGVPLYFNIYKELLKHSFSIKRDM